MRAAAWAALVGLSLLEAQTGCSSNCCTFDEQPIALLRAGGDAQTAGALLALATTEGRPLTLVFDTGSPLTFFSGPLVDTPTLQGRSFALVDGRAGEGATSPRRAILNDIGTLTVPLSPLSDGSQPDGVFGADLMRGYSVEMSFSQASAPTVTFWSRQGASDDALASAGFAVLHTTLFGGTEISAQGGKDFFGMRGPLYVSPSRVVLRTCANAPPFTPTGAAPPACCASSNPHPRAGADLSLALTTGLGPLVLSESAWTRLQTAYARDTNAGTTPAALPALQDGPEIRLATWPEPVPARWSTLPHLAFVDLQTTVATDLGPCVELARARRIEWAEAQRAAGTSACFATCDQDPQDAGRSATTAPYVEMSRGLPVAVVSDTSDVLQGIRAEIRPEGPEIDGLVGAAALADLHLELDYRSTPARAIFACEVDDRAACFAAPRCEGTRPSASWRGCFDLAAPATTPPAACFAPRC